MFSVAVCRIATSSIIVLDIDSILPHVKGEFSAFLCVELCLHEVRHMRPEDQDSRKTTIKHTENTQEHSSLLYEFPGGNQVDGLPPVAHNDS